MSLPGSAIPIPVVAAVIRDGQRFLVSRRPDGCWEFPGGKIEPEEQPQQALKRELLEELAIEVEVGQRLLAIEHAYPDRLVLLQVFACQIVQGQPKSVGVTELKWLRPEEISSLNLLAADEAIVAYLKNRLAGP